MIGEHKLRLLFEDGTVGDVSFRDDPWDGVFAPLKDPARFVSFRDDPWDGVFAPLKDPARFATVTVLDGTLYWPADELDWAPEPLYEAARTHALAAAQSRRPRLPSSTR